MQNSLTALIEQLTKLPGVGTRSAERMAFHILKSSPDEAKALADSILRLKERLKNCRLCNFLSEDEHCHICQDSRRDKRLICVTEESKDVLAIEKTGSFKGLYHVLLGALSPLEGITPDELKIEGLLKRINENGVEEVIIATDSDTEGDTTALYLTQIIKASSMHKAIKITRIASGLPIGGYVEYTDPATLAKAIEGRILLT